MGKLDLSKEISFQDLKNIDIKKSLQKNKKVVIPSKKGINLVPQKKKAKLGLVVIVAALVAVAALFAVAYFGFYKPISAKHQAQAEYDNAHLSYAQALAAVADYDEILEEYQSYSLDWMNKDTSRRYVSVHRETILEMMDKTVKPAGTLNSFSISGDSLTIRMSDMTLTEVTQMLMQIEQEPFVSYAFLQQATSQETQTLVLNEDGEEELVTGPETVVFTLTVNLRKPVEEEAQ